MIDQYQIQSEGEKGNEITQVLSVFASQSIVQFVSCAPKMSNAL